ncbi:MAG: 2-oxo acid dehydrogenase subunit E2 [Planctomycetaceae bacterium]
MEPTGELRSGAMEPAFARIAPDAVDPAVAPPNNAVEERSADGEAADRSCERSPANRMPLHESPEALDDLSLWNFYYLNTCPPPRDPTIVWGTDVDCTGLQTWLRGINAESSVLVTPAHVLVAATGRALATHPQFNRRILKKRIWRYREVNVVMPFRANAALDVMFFGNVDTKPVGTIATEAWRSVQSAAGTHDGVPSPIYMRFPRRLQALLQPMHVWLVNRVNLPLRGANHRQRAAVAMVNYFGHRGMAPLRSFKPSRLPYDSITLTVTMGAVEPRPVVQDGEVVVRPVAPVFVRADHRIVDAHEIGLFAETLRTLLADPGLLERSSEEHAATKA